ncbi:MAG: Uncharacterized protein XD86_0738, partial [Mesotoga infera]
REPGGDDLRKKNALFTLAAIIFFILLTSGCTGYILTKPDSIVTRLEREINRGREDRILELYAEEIWVATSGSPSGRLLSKQDVAYFYSEFFELYDGITYRVEVHGTERDSREATRIQQSDN